MKKNFSLASSICYSFRVAPWVSMAIIVLSIGVGVIPSLLVVAEQRLIDIGVELFTTKSFSNHAIMAIAGVIAFMCVEWCGQIAIKICKIKQNARVKRNFRGLLLGKVNRVQYAVLEQNETQDLTSRILSTPENHITSVFDNASLLLRYGFTIVSLVAVLFVYIGYLALVIVMVALLLFALARKSGKETYQMQKSNSHDARMGEYYQDLLLKKEYADERSAYHFEEAVDGRWEKVSQTIKEKEARLSAKWFMNQKIASILLYAVSFIIIVILIDPVVQGVVTIGFLIAYVNATFNLSNTVSRIVTDVVETLYKEAEYCKDYDAFSLLPENTATSNPAALLGNVEAIVFDDVSFTYPNASEPTLSHCSFELSGNKQYALVGINGAGKTTIVKLLTGCYDTYSGNIRINGIDIKDMDQSMLAKLFSAVSQDFAMYQISLRENLLLGTREDAAVSNEVIATVLRNLGLGEMLDRLPKGLDTEIGKIYPDGIDFSHGQWQKLAIARAMLKPGTALILDEPTASLDPIAEGVVYADISAMSGDRLTLLISHRLGATKDADEILLISNGTVFMQGTHKVLMAECDAYSKMYNTQKKWYVQ